MNICVVHAFKASLFLQQLVKKKPMHFLNALGNCIITLMAKNWPTRRSAWSILWARGSGVARVGQLPGHQEFCLLIFISRPSLAAIAAICAQPNALLPSLYMTKQTLLTNLISMSHLEVNLLDHWLTVTQTGPRVQKLADWLPGSRTVVARVWLRHWLAVA